MICPGTLVYNIICSVLFSVLTFNLKIVENNVFSDVHIFAARDVHNVSISQVLF